MTAREFGYELPPDRIAQAPAEPRDRSKLLVMSRNGSGWADREFRDVGFYLRRGDLLIANDTRVVPARLRGRKPTGGAAEVLLLTREGADRWEALVRAAGRVRPGTRVVLDPRAEVEVLEERGEGVFGVRVVTPEDALETVERLGEMPLPPYIHREVPDRRDREWYQTLFAREETAGSAAAPTAGLHFTSDVLLDLDRRGVERRCLTLHVGLGTFLPVRAERLEDHRMHREWYHLPRQTADAVNAALEQGRRVVAVGTTTTRVLEHCGRSGRVKPGSGWTDLFIRPGYRFRILGGLITNFHLPESTLLALVCAFAGRDRVLDAYRHALDAGYRFYSYGDAMLVL